MSKTKPTKKYEKYSQRFTSLKKRYDTLSLKICEYLADYEELIEEVETLLSEINENMKSEENTD